MPRLWKRMRKSLWASVRHFRERHGKPGQRQSGTTHASAIGDLEARPLGRRRLHCEGNHAMLSEESSGSLRNLEEMMGMTGGDDDVQNKYAKLELDMSFETKQKAIMEARDAYWDLKKATLDEKDFDEEEIMRKFARKSLLSADSTPDLMLTAELLIEEDWLGKVDALPGNIYRLAVMGDIFVTTAGQSLKDRVSVYAKIFGILSIIMIQLLGPPLIFFSRFKGIGVLYELGYKWHCCPWHPQYDPASSEACFYQETAVSDVTYFDDWHHIATTKLLGILMMITFILNSLFVLLDERHSWKQIYNTFRYLDVLNDKFHVAGIPYLYLDAIVNSWVITWCSLDVFLVIGAAQSPVDVLMNALGLVFLYNLDDVGGDLGFVNEDDWPGSRLAWIYEDLVHTCDATIFDEDKLDTPGFVILSLYEVTIGMMTLMVFLIPVLTACTPFIQIVPE